MPDCIRANTNVTTMVIGERIADFIRKRTTAEHPVDRVYGILGKDALGKGVGVDEYIEQIRGR